MIAIIDYDAGNLRSVEKALIHLGQEVMITRNKEEILSADKVILPGDGHFGFAMDRLRSYGLIDTIKEVVSEKKPFLGICLGLQILFERSDEAEGIDGLGILKGEILRIPDNEGLKIPHMGWNTIKVNPESRLFRGIEDDSYIYFVHSYYLKARNEDEVAATTYYSTKIDAAVEKDNLFACQFHPEKSGEVGIKILKNFIAL
jgi:glutamine amidotransferase